MTKTLLTGLLPTALLILASTSLSAATFTFNGAFTRDDQIGLYQLSVTAPGLITMSTNSYAAEGFSPVLSLFDSQNTNLLVGRDNGLDHTGGEASLSQELAAGTYILALTQYDNLATGPRLSDGFLRTGDPSFTGEFETGIGPFLDINGTQRTGTFGVTITNVASVLSVPEPSNLTLGIVGGFCLFCRFRKYWSRHRSVSGESRARFLPSEMKLP